MVRLLTVSAPFVHQPTRAAGNNATACSSTATLHTHTSPRARACPSSSYKTRKSGKPTASAANRRPALTRGRKEWMTDTPSDGHLDHRLKVVNNFIDLGNFTLRREPRRTRRPDGNQHLPHRDSLTINPKTSRPHGTYPAPAGPGRP